MAAPRYFHHAGLVLVRASTDPGGLSLPALDLHTADGADTIGRAWLARLWDREVVRTALSIASPALCEQISEVLSGARLPHRQWRRLLISVCSYVLRWQHRPTPFGLFAGITTATISQTVRSKFGEDHGVLARCDPAWLDEVIGGLEREPAVLAEAVLVVNNAGVTRGDRFVVPKNLPTRSAESERIVADLGEVDLSLLRTRPVAVALDGADRPVHGRELIARLEEEFPAADRGQITTMLAELVANRVLLTNLRAPATHTDPVAHLLDQLDAIERNTGRDERAPGMERVVEVRGALRLLHHQMTTPDPHTGKPVALRAGTAVRSHAPDPSTLSESPPRPGVDVVVDGQLALPEAVLREAEGAASALLRLTHNPFGTPPWRDYHVRFRDRYGAGAAVPVHELVSDAGLGYPVGFLGAAREQPIRGLNDRDAVLQRLVQEAVLDGRIEVVLSEPVIDQLAVGDHADLLPPGRVELAFTVQSHSTDALERGRFELWVSGAPPASSSMIGRFTSLFDDRDRDRFASSYDAPDPDVLSAQLSFRPRRMHNDAVTRTPRLLPWLLPIADPASAMAGGAEAAGHLDVDALVVTATATQFFLIHRPTGKQVHAHVLNALETTVFTPPLVRFLAELATSRSAVFGPLDFGATRTLPFLPRLRYGRSVLAPARWLLYRADLPGPQVSAHDWQVALSSWRQRWRVPAHVVLCEGEQRLPLDLEQPTQCSLLRARLHRANHVELREAGAPSSQGWTGRACEFVVPLAATRPDQLGKPPPRGQPTNTAAPAAHDCAASSTPSLPAVPGGAELVLAQLEGHPQRFDEILTGHLPRLHERLIGDAVRLWFQRRHNTTRPDSDHYLQIFVRLVGVEQYGTVAGHLAAWTEELRRAGLAAQLSFETAWTQSGKYGTGNAMSEPVFTADSDAALAELGLVQRARIPVQAVAAVSMADLAARLAPRPELGCQWLTTVLPQRHGQLGRELREESLRLAHHLGHFETAAAERRTEQEEAVLTAWARRGEALTTYRTHLDRDPSGVLRALLHDHVTRTVGVGPDREQDTNRLARAIALRAQALNAREQP
ncbi:lantibiotic dehydratase [Saccharopolyspora cebuensis]|uniref:lantibiotic dehydratase n=1 Tax=Saccharopolyspora cebuensis TaxID=418759 RepID=UPI0031EE74C9